MCLTAGAPAGDALNHNSTEKFEISHDVSGGILARSVPSKDRCWLKLGMPFTAVNVGWLGATSREPSASVGDESFMFPSRCHSPTTSVRGVFTICVRCRSTVLPERLIQ